MMQRMLFTLSLVGMAAASTGDSIACPNGFEYDADLRPGYGDICRGPKKGSWECPAQCVMDVTGIAPFCLMIGKEENEDCRPSRETACPEGFEYEDHDVTGHNDVCRATSGSGDFMCPDHCEKLGSEGEFYCSYKGSGGRPCRLFDAELAVPAGCPAFSFKYEAHTHPSVGDICRKRSGHALCPNHCKSTKKKDAAVCRDKETGQPCRADPGINGLEGACSAGFTYEANTANSMGDVCRYKDDSNFNCPVHCDYVAGKPHCVYQGSKQPCRLYEATLCPKGKYVSRKRFNNRGDYCRHPKGVKGYPCPRGCSRVTGTMTCKKTGTTEVCRAKDE